MAPEKKPTPVGSTTSIHALQRDESLAGFAARCGQLTDEAFLSLNPDPVLITSMPTDVNLAVWSFILPVRKKKSRGSLDKTISKQAKALWEEVAAKLNRIYVGRAPECDVVLAPRSLSRRHAVLKKKDDAWFIVDLDSSNGTSVGGKPLTAKTAVHLKTSPVKIEFGNETAVWFVLPKDFLAYLRGLSHQVSETSKHSIEKPDAAPVPAETPDLGTKVHVQRKKSSSSLPALPPAQQVAGSETKPPSTPRSAGVTWHDDDLMITSTSVPKLPPKEAPKSDPEPKLIATIRAVAALDSLILGVAVQLKTDPKVMVIYSADSNEKEKISDVADQLLRLGPLLKTVQLMLSVGDGTPVEIYTA